MATVASVKQKQAGGGFSAFQRKIAPYIFISPFYISFLTFSTFPIFYSLFLSFQSWNGIGAMNYVGFKNYFAIFKDQLFWKTVLNTFGMLFWTAIPQHFIGMGFAFILNQGLVKFKEFFKGVMFVPYLTSSVAVAIVFSVIYGTQYGFMNYLLRFFEPILPIKLPIEWLRGYTTWFTLSSLTTWRWTGWNAILYLAGLQAIPNTLYEAARIDGATWWQIFTRITIPLLKPVIYFATTMTIIGNMQLFDEPMVMIGLQNRAMELRGNYGMTLAVYMYAWAFNWSRFGLACATSYIIFLIILILTFINRRIFKEE
ncbi:MAG: carbohydrate ABC transporter permease [Brevinematia bacterium]